MIHSNGTTKNITANFGPLGIVIRARPLPGGPTLKTKIGIITLLIAGLMILTAGLASAQEPNAISGTVTDAITGETIEGAKVQVDGSDPLISAQTDASGRYTLEGVPVGEQSITVSAAEYVGETVAAVDAEAAGAVLEFSLPP